MGAIHHDEIIEALAESIETHAKLLTTALYTEESRGQNAYTVAACVDMLDSELRHLKDRYDILHTQYPHTIPIG